MTWSRTTIRFNILDFVDISPSLHRVEERLKKYLRTLRYQKQDEEIEEGNIDRAEMSDIYEFINDENRSKYQTSRDAVS